MGDVNTSARIAKQQQQAAVKASNNNDDDGGSQLAAPALTKPQQLQRTCNAKHRLICELTNGKCCSCLDTRDRAKVTSLTSTASSAVGAASASPLFKPKAIREQEEAAEMAAASAAAAATAAEPASKHNKKKQKQQNKNKDTDSAAAATSSLWYRDYCPSCRAFFEKRDAKRQREEAAKFALWCDQPWTDRKRSGLMVNWALRHRLPFDLSHVVLTFLLDIPPVLFFKFIDCAVNQRVLPTVEEVLKTRAYQHRRYGAVMSGPGPKTPCTHSFCELGIRAASTHRSPHYGHRSYGCCSCLDKRVYKDVDVVYVDGKGDQVVEVDFWQHYCTGCRNHFSQYKGSRVLY